MQTNTLAHHGIKGQKWGERRYQNPDGSLTPEGKARLNKKFDKIANSKIRSKYHAFNAIGVYQMNANTAKAYSDRAQKQIDKNVGYARKVLDKMSKGKYDNASEKKLKRELNTLVYKEAETKALKQRKQVYDIIHNEANQKIADIKSGKLKAGRDFIYKRETNMLSLDSMYTVIDKNNKKLAAAKSNYRYIY